MAKRITVILFSLALIFSVVSLSSGFDNNKENFDSKTGEPVPYTPDNINSGKLKGGHDTLTAEGALLKKDVHNDNQDFKKWVDEEALPSLRTGAHDEDTYRYPLTDKYYANDRPIGSNKDVDDDFFTHFLDPSKVYKTTLCTTDGCKEGYYDQGAGLKGAWPPATQRARDYIKDIQKMICEKGGIDKLSEDDKKKLYDDLGRIMHLIEDMAQPAHTNNDMHPFTPTFEDYVRDNWGSIVRDVISQKVTQSGYTGGGYNKGSASTPEEYLLSLAKISKGYHTDGLWGSIGDLNKDINDPANSKLKENVDNLIPLAINFVGGYI